MVLFKSVWLFCTVGVVFGGFCDHQGFSGFACDGNVRKHCSCSYEYDRRLLVARRDENDDDEVFNNRELSEDMMSERNDLRLFGYAEKKYKTKKVAKKFTKKLKKGFKKLGKSSPGVESFNYDGPEWECEKTYEEHCSLGCANSRCTQTDEVCGTSWSGSLMSERNGATCESLFYTETEKELRMCERVTAPDNRVCPLKNYQWGYPGSTYTSWLDIMNSESKTKDLLRAAALDAHWFRDVFFGRLYIVNPDLNATDVQLVENVTKSLMDYYESQKSYFTAFSCHRNIPECHANRGALVNCISVCKKVSQIVKGFNDLCVEKFDEIHSNNSSNTTKFECFGLGYERDCDGTNSINAEYPNLCAEFQNDFLGSSNSGNKIFISLGLLTALSFSFLELF